MRRVIVLTLVSLISLGSVFAITSDPAEAKVYLSVESPSEATAEVGFSSAPVSSWDNVDTKLTEIPLVANNDGTYGFTTTGESGLYAYAKIYSAEEVTIDLESSRLVGYASKPADGSASALGSSSTATGADNPNLSWTIKGSSYNVSNLDCDSTIGTTFDTEGAKNVESIFVHKKSGSAWANSNMNVYCVALDIASPEGADYRQTSATTGANYWETTLTIKVHSES